MDDQIKAEFAALAQQISKGFADNDKQFRTLKSRMAKMELASLKRMENRRSEEIMELKAKR